MCSPFFDLEIFLYALMRVHSDRVVTLSAPTSEIRVRFTAQPQVGKLVVACHWLAVYSAEPWPTVFTDFLYPNS